MDTELIEEGREEREKLELSRLSRLGASKKNVSEAGLFRFKHSPSNNAVTNMSAHFHEAFFKKKTKKTEASCTAHTILVEGALCPQSF